MKIQCCENLSNGAFDGGSKKKYNKNLALPSHLDWCCNAALNVKKTLTELILHGTGNIS